MQALEVIVLVNTVDTNCTVADTARAVVIVTGVSDDETCEAVVYPVLDGDVVHDDDVSTAFTGKAAADFEKLSVDSGESEMAVVCSQESVAAVDAADTNEWVVASSRVSCAELIPASCDVEVTADTRADAGNVEVTEDTCGASVLALKSEGHVVIEI